MPQRVKCDNAVMRKYYYSLHQILWTCLADFVCYYIALFPKLLCTNEIGIKQNFKFEFCNSER